MGKTVEVKIETTATDPHLTKLKVIEVEEKTHKNIIGVGWDLRKEMSKFTWGGISTLILLGISGAEISRLFIPIENYPEIARQTFAVIEHPVGIATLAAVGAVKYGLDAFNTRSRIINIKHSLENINFVTNTTPHPHTAPPPQTTSHDITT